MRRRTWLAALAAAALTSSARAAIVVGKLMPWGQRTTPALQAKALEDGRAVSLTEFSGQVVLLNFWATFCEPCEREMPALNRLLLKYGAQGLKVVGVNCGEMPQRVREFLDERVIFDGLPLLDRSQAQLKAWGIPALPASVLIDRQGRAQAWHVGELNWDAPEVQQVVKDLLAQR